VLNNEVIKRGLVKDCYSVDLDLSFKDVEQLSRFLFLIKTLLRCKLSRDEREKYFGNARQGKAFMSKILYIPKIRYNRLESLDICIVAEDSKDYEPPENLKDEIRELYLVFTKVENEYYKDKKVTDFPELSKFFKNCIGRKR